MSLARNFVDSTEQHKEAVDYVLDDGETILVYRSQTAVSANAGFDGELSEHQKIVTIKGRIDPKGDSYVGLTDWLDCEVNDVWRKMNVRDEHVYYLVKEVKPRLGGIQVDMERYTKWQR